MVSHLLPTNGAYQTTSVLQPTASTDMDYVSNALKDPLIRKLVVQCQISVNA